MPHLTNVPWPPDPITTERLRLRPTQATDRPGYIELFCREDARRYLGGALDREEVEATMPATPGERPGVFAVELVGEFIGVVTLDRRDSDRPGRLRESGGDLEIGYMFRPAWWGNGYATEACTAVLGWAEAFLPSEPIILCTQAAHEASIRLATRIGFREVERFVEYDADQWFGVRDEA